MRLLAKRQVNTQIQLERGKQVREGVALAERVDALREARAKEEQQLLAYRAQAIAKVQEDIDAIIVIRDRVKSEVKEATELREVLIRPLNKEWQELNLEKSEVAKEKDRVSIAHMQLKEEESRHAQELVKLAAASEVQRVDEDKLKEEKKRIARLKKLTEQQYATALEEHNQSVERDGKERHHIATIRASYETGLETLEAERKQIEEREAEVIKMQTLLADRSAMLERDMARLNKE